MTADPETKDLDEKEPLVFFNYHEFIASPEKQDPLSESQNSTHSTKPDLVVTHFPNPYTTAGSDEYNRTRIVRVPRSFESTQNSYMVPQFSVYIPGHEPAALSRQQTEFTPAGTYHGYEFGSTSLTPLVPGWLSEAEFRDIVTTLNELLHTAFSPGNKATWFDNALDFFTGSLYSSISTHLSKSSAIQRGMAAVESYVAQVNGQLAQKHGDLRLISPARSAMVSLDFQIPMISKVSESGASIGSHGKEDVQHEGTG